MKNNKNSPACSSPPRLVALALALPLLLAACGQQSAINTKNTSNLTAKRLTTLSIEPAQHSIKSGEILHTTLSLKEGQPLKSYEIELTGVNGVIQSKQQIVFTTDEHGIADTKIDFLPDSKTAGTAALIAVAGGEVVSANLNLIFEQGKVMTTSQQEIEASYPRLVGPNMGSESVGIKPVSLKPLVAQPQSVGKAIPDVAIVDNVQYLLPNGKLSNQMSGIQYKVPNTGAGQPSQADLSENTTPSITAQYACGTQQVNITFNNIIDGVTRPLPKGTYIRASEQNSLTDSIQAEGWIGDNGVFTFPMQICDTGNLFSRDAPDLYFIVETRNNIGLTETHGTLARRHWWRTNTWWNTSPSAVNGMTVQVSGSNAEAELARQLWHKINRVYDWNRDAMSAKYAAFPLDVLYPVSTYAGVAPLARAAIRQLQIPYGDANNTTTLFHEFGHEVYYRQMLGAAQWANYDTATSFTVPTCGGCLGHGYDTNSGPEAAMVEGWADFFEAVSTGTLGYNGPSAWIESPSIYPNIPTGLGNETRVAAYLYDLYDNHAEEVNADGQPRFANTRNDDDNYRPGGLASQRYSAVASYFFDGSLSSELQQNWFQRIKPALSAGQVTEHCVLLLLNTLQAVDRICPQQ